MKKHKVKALFLFLFVCLTSVVSAEKLGENLLYKEDDMNPKLFPKSEISEELIGYWGSKTGKKPVFIGELLYEIPANDKSIEDISKILRSFSTMEGIEYYSETRKKTMVLYEECYTVSDLKSKKEIPDQTEGNADGQTIYMFQKDQSFGKTPYEVKYWQNEDEIAFNAINRGPLYAGILPAVKEESVCLTLYVKKIENKLNVYVLAQADFMNLPSFMEKKIRSSFMSRLDALYNWFTGQYYEK